MQQKIEIKPQPGPQEVFLSSKADFALFGGSAGSGKSFALLMEPLRHMYNKKFGAVIFRRSMVQVRNQGSLWDESMKLYSILGAEPLEYKLQWNFKNGMTIKFSHLEHEKDVFTWQGSQIAMIGFDEISHFTESQVIYMMSRNRSDSGVPGYIRATCNPDSESWLRKWVDWYIDKEGYPIKERSGVLRWFIRINDQIIWADTRDELIKTYGEDQLPKSFTFVSALIYDNKILMEKDPSYLSNLKALGKVERERLLEGNWNVRPAAGNFFRREWYTIIDEIPAGWIRQCRYWDRAATKPSPSNPDPDWTRGLRLLEYPNGTFLVADLKSTRDTPGGVENLIKSVASHDGVACQIWGEQDPGSAGVSDAQAFTKMLRGYNVRIAKPTKDKETRAQPVSAQSEAGNINVLRGTWNEEFFRELENFPEGNHDDIVDVFSGAFNALSGKGSSVFDSL